MKVPARRRQYGLRIDLTPLNDIVFLLIIFLVASPHFKPADAKDEVDIPTVDVNRGAVSDSERRLEVTVTRSGGILIGGKSVTLPELKRRISEAGRKYRGRFELRLRCDRRATYGQTRPIRDACVAAGIYDIKYAVLPDRNG
ncbi:MAG: ExbD/TolR family protein [Planctomycetaceae bacterium]